MGQIKYLRNLFPQPKEPVLPEYQGTVQFSSVAQSCPTLCDPMNRSTPQRWDKPPSTPLPPEPASILPLGFYTPPVPGDLKRSQESSRKEYLYSVRTSLLDARKARSRATPRPFNADHLQLCRYCTLGLLNKPPRKV